MALIGKILSEDKDRINVRAGTVLADFIIEKEYFQLRTYAMGDTEKKRGQKQNIQLSKEKAKELIVHLEKFVNQ